MATLISRSQLTATITIIGICVVVAILLYSGNVVLPDYYTGVAIALSTSIVPIFYWGFRKQINALFHTISQAEPIIDKKEHTVILNNTVYRKLTHILACEDRNSLLDFMIPTDPNAFKRRNEQGYADSILLRARQPRCSGYSSIDYELIHLSKGLDHLRHTEYKDVYGHYDVAEMLRNEYNNSVTHIQSQITEKVKTKMTQDFVDLVEFDGWGTKNSYISDAISSTLYYYRFDGYKKGKILDFEFITEKLPDEEFYKIVSKLSGWTLLQGPNKEKLDEKKLADTLRSICIELDLDSKFNRLYEIHKQVENNLQPFRDLLEDKIVNNIDAGHILKGECSACR